MLFSDRAEAAIKHDPPLPVLRRKAKQQKWEEPDRVYGLKETDNFKMLLNSADKRASLDSNTRRLRESLEVSPFSQEGEPLLFPFLILEAKSGREGDSAAVEMQTAFCIRRLLKLQHDLRMATEEETLWKSGPLVWFLNWYGERWSIAASFVDNTNGDLQYVSISWFSHYSSSGP
jgi:hypothetical protein